LAWPFRVRIKSVPLYFIGLTIPPLRPGTPGSPI